MSDVTLKRIMDLETQSEVDNSVYTIIDSPTGYGKKYPLGSFIASVAPIFDSTAAYTAGSYCNYNGQIYRFTADHAAGSWTGSDVTAVNVGGELSDLKQELKADKISAFSVMEAINIGTLVVSGQLDPQTGSNKGNSAKTTRTGYIACDHPVLFYINSPDYEYAIWTYTDNSSSYAVATQTNYKYTSEPTIIYPGGGQNKFRIGIRRLDNADLTTTSSSSSDFSIIKNGARFYKITDSTLTQNERPADAGALNDRIIKKIEPKHNNHYDLVLNETNGHARYYEFDTTGEEYYIPMDIYDSNNVVTGSILGTDFIRIPYDNCLVNLLVQKPNLDYAAQYYIYFYNSNKQPVWDVFDITDSTTGHKNLISCEDLIKLNGSQFVDVPKGYYIRIASPTKIMNLLLWDGIKFGASITAVSEIYDENVNKARLSEDAVAGIVVPSKSYIMVAKPGYTFVDVVTSTDAVSERIEGAEKRFPTQCMYTNRWFAGSGRNKNVMIVKNYDYDNKTYDEEMVNGDISDYVVQIFEEFGMAERPIGIPRLTTMSKVQQLLSMEWECKKDFYDNEGVEGDNGIVGVFHQGIKYHGIPYRSDWLEACYAGWHTTKHTFLNAANDPDSIFYSKDAGSYYCLVCSSFGTLVTGFQYPQTNFSMMRDPHNIIQKTSQPEIGQLLTNGVSHCFVIAEKYTNDSGDLEYVKLAEEGTPYSLVRNIYSSIPNNWHGMAVRGTYLYNYQFSISPDYVFEAHPPFDIQSGTITDGTARPYRGDRSVYTSDMDVDINIKDASATRLYYQKFNVTCTRGNITSATAVGSPSYVTIPSGDTKITLRSKTEDGNYTGVSLEDGAVYGVWASVDDAQATAPTNVEYFEWHDNTAHVPTYDIEDGTLVTDEEFWYVIAEGVDYKKPVRDGNVNGAISIMYQNKMNVDGTQAEHSDYSNYRERIYLKKIRAFFKKGKLGAYVSFFDGSPIAT